MVFEQFTYYSRRPSASKRLRPRNARMSVTKSTLTHGKPNGGMNQTLQNKLTQCTSLPSMTKTLFVIFGRRFYKFIWSVTMAIPIYLINQTVGILRYRRSLPPKPGAEAEILIKNEQFYYPRHENHVETIVNQESSSSLTIEDSVKSEIYNDNESVDCDSFVIEETLVHVPLTPESIVSVESESSVEELKGSIFEGKEVPSKHENLSKIVPVLQQNHTTSSAQQMPVQGKYMDYWKKLGLINSAATPAQHRQTLPVNSTFSTSNRQSDSRKSRRNSHSTNFYRPSNNESNKSWGYQKNNPFINQTKQQDLLPKTPEHWRVNKPTQQKPSLSSSQLFPSSTLNTSNPAGSNGRPYSIFDCPVSMLDNFDGENFLSSFTWNWRNEEQPKVPNKNVFFPEPQQQSRNHLQPINGPCPHGNMANGNGVMPRQFGQISTPSNIHPLSGNSANNAAMEHQHFHSSVFVKNTPSETSMQPKKSTVFDDEYLSYEQFQREFVSPFRH